MSTMNTMNTVSTAMEGPRIGPLIDYKLLPPPSRCWQMAFSIDAGYKPTGRDDLELMDAFARELPQGVFVNWDAKPTHFEVSITILSEWPESEDKHIIGVVQRIILEHEFRAPVVHEEEEGNESGTGA